ERADVEGCCRQNTHPRLDLVDASENRIIMNALERLAGSGVVAERPQALGVPELRPTAGIRRPFGHRREILQGRLKVLLGLGTVPADFRPTDNEPDVSECQLDPLLRLLLVRKRFLPQCREKVLQFLDQRRGSTVVTLEESSFRLDPLQLETRYVG